MDVPEKWLRHLLLLSWIDDAALLVDSHPDTGKPALRLDASIQQYGLFVAKAAVHFGDAEVRTFVEHMVENVQLSTDQYGETTFWLNGITMTQ